MTLRVSCLGDSLTRGQLSVDYVELLRQRFHPSEVQFSRFGVNGDFAYNLLQRLDSVLAVQADVVTVLIGTNDARASLPGYPVAAMMRRKGLPRPPSAAWFEQSLYAIVARLQSQTCARIALLSLPVLGQDLSAAPAQAARSYSQTIADVAAARGLGYLPLHERQVETLQRQAPSPVRYQELTPTAFIGTMLERVLLRRSLDRISERRNLLLTIDHVHQNSRGASLIADVIDAELRRGTRDANVGHAPADA